MNVNTLCMSCMQNDSGDPVCPGCGAPFDLQAKNTLQLKPRTVLRDQYVIGRALGHGGFGVTYLAWDIGLETRLAVKEYLPNGVAGRASGETKVLPYSQNTQPEFEWGLDRFLEEARTLKKFSRFPGIVSVDTIFRDNGTAYLVMEFLDGWTLEEFLKRRGGKITFETALRITLPVIDALSAVHAEGVLHRDISPDNILLARDGKVKLIDFGAARNALSQKSRNLSIILKEGYAPEEQYRAGGIQGPWTDVYATAATIYHAITGARPPSALDRLAGENLQRPGDMGIEIDYDAERALMFAMSLKAADRFQSMEDFKAGLTGSASITAMMRAVDPNAPLGGPIPATIAAAPTRSYHPSAPQPHVSAPPHLPNATSNAPPAYPSAVPPSRPLPYLPPPVAGPPPRTPKGGSLGWIVAAAFGLIALIAVGAAIFLRRPNPAPQPIAQITLANVPSPVPDKSLPDNSNPSSGQPSNPADAGKPDDSNPGASLPSALPSPAPAPVKPSPIKSSAGTSPSNPSSPDRPSPLAPAPIPAPEPNPASSAPGVKGGGDYASLIEESKDSWAQHEYPRVRNLLNQAIALDPNKPRAYSGLAELNLYIFTAIPNARRNARLAIEHGGEAVFHVIHDHSGETFAVHGNGKLLISATEVRFVPESGPHGFISQKSDLREIRRNRILGIGIGRQKPADLHPFHIRLANGQNFNFAPTSHAPEAERDLIIELLGEH